MKEIVLYNHNQEAYKKIKEGFKSSNRVAIVQATGTGKGYIILKYINDNQVQNKVVLAPSNYILNQMKSEAKGELPNTIPLTYSKLYNMSDEKMKSLDIGSIIIDEFHRCGAKQWGNGVDRLIRHFPHAKILGTSATPIRFLDRQRDMTDELFQNNVVSSLDLNTAIIKGILPMPKYVGAIYNYEEEFNKLTNNINNSNTPPEYKRTLYDEIEKLKNKISNSNGIDKILKKYLEKEKSYKFIAFCKNKEHLQEVEENMGEWFEKANLGIKLNMYKIFSGNNLNKANLDRFYLEKTKTIDILLSIDIFNEGIHIHDIDGVFLLRPTCSGIVYFQQIGRAIQTGKNSTPIIFDLVNNFDNLYVGDFIKGLKEANRINGQNEKEIKRMDEKINFSIIDEIKDFKVIFQELHLKISDTWNYYYTKLLKFAPLNKNLNIDYEGDERFKDWVKYQRSAKKSGVMSQDRINKLDMINFPWDISEVLDEVNNLIWYRKLGLLKEYKTEFGNITLKKGELYKGENLYVWCKVQKALYRDGLLEDYKIKELELMGFVWNMIEQKWSDMYDIASEYVKEFNTYHIPDLAKYKDVNIGRWYTQQKRKYKDGNLSVDKISLLEALGIEWEYEGKAKQILKLKELGIPITSTEKKWEKRYNELERFIKNNNRIPKRRGKCKDVDIDMEYELAEFLKNQKCFYKKNKLNERKVSLLQSLGVLSDL